MLYSYYDIHRADIFDGLFAPLYIGKNPTSSGNKLLVLKLDLSLIRVSGSVNKMKASFNRSINQELDDFLMEYRDELGGQEDFAGVIDDSRVSSFVNRLDTTMLPTTALRIASSNGN
ncbi:hypothetical protein EDD21DRAFT_72217 [Dissophora ornata]|nr:hypothetical protein EDD21DRAFT_72217 [Dissophora ornata]